jgi:hypothetical protein
VLLCGGKDNASLSRVDIALRGMNIGTIVTGDSRGYDSLAKQWAYENQIKCKVYKTDYDKYGKRAGYKRNVAMFDENLIDTVIAFPGGRGSDIIIAIAESANIPIIKV